MKVKLIRDEGAIYKGFSLASWIQIVFACLQYIFENVCITTALLA
jgi:hypothetical protein